MVANVEVTEVEQTRSRVRLKTKDGQSITAKYAVFCTGYELMKFARPKGYKIISTWALGNPPAARQDMAQQKPDMGSCRSLPLHANHWRGPGDRGR